MHRPRFLSRRSAWAAAVLRQGNLRRRHAPGCRAARRRMQVLAAGPAYRRRRRRDIARSRKRADRLPAGLVVGGKEGATVADELSGFSPEPGRRLIPAVIPFYQTRTHGGWGVGIDAVSALDVWPFGFPGFKGLNLDPGSAPHMGYTAAGYADGGSYTFHFPDGNARIARLLVRSLDPAEPCPGKQRRRRGHGADRLRPARSSGGRPSHPARQHSRRSRRKRRSGLGERSRDRVCARLVNSSRCTPSTACSLAGT